MWKEVHRRKTTMSGEDGEQFYVAGFEVSTAVVMKNIIFWDMAPCIPLCSNRRFGGT
jgi:hypothetical protein